MDSMDKNAENHLREVIALNLEKISLRFELIDKMIALQKSENDKALHIQVKELERRLESLNNEAARIKAMEVKYVQVDLFDAKLTATNGKIESLTKLLYIGIGIVGVLEIGLAMMWVFFR